MEESRLKPMVADYNPILFNDIYQKTEGLRRKLAAGIDHRRFGVDQEEIRSWFTVKFIYAYNKYCKQYNPDVLLGHMIKSMQFFRCRVIRAAYAFKYSQNIVEFTGSEIKEVEDPFDESRDFYYEQAIGFLKSHMSDNAYMLLQLQINPPPYILIRLHEKGNGTLHKIPDELIAEYFDLGYEDETFEYIRNLKKEIKRAICNARDHFITA